MKQKSVRNLANYIVRLYYFDKRKCTSSAVQKLLIIAQLYSLYALEKPLFEESLMIDFYALYIPIIRNTYSDDIFNGDELKQPLDDILDIKANVIKKPSIDFTKCHLSTFYDIDNFYSLSNEEIELLDLVYCYFGTYSKKCLNNQINKLSLHDSHKIDKEITYYQLQEYVDNIPSLDSENIVIKFIKESTNDYPHSYKKIKRKKY